MGEFLECGQRLGIRMGVDTVAESRRDIRLDLLETRGLRHAQTVLGFRPFRQPSKPRVPEQTRWVELMPREAPGVLKGV